MLDMASSDVIDDSADVLPVMRPGAAGRRVRSGVGCRWQRQPAVQTDRLASRSSPHVLLQSRRGPDGDRRMSPPTRVRSLDRVWQIWAVASPSAAANYADCRLLRCMVVGPGECVQAAGENDYAHTLSRIDDRSPEAFPASGSLSSDGAEYRRQRAVDCVSTCVQSRCPEGVTHGRCMLFVVLHTSEDGRIAHAQSALASALSNFSSFPTGSGSRTPGPILPDEL